MTRGHHCPSPWSPWPLLPTSIVNRPHRPSTTHIGCWPPKTMPRHQPNECRRGQGDTMKQWGEMTWQWDIWWWWPGCVLPAQVSTSPPLPRTNFPQQQGTTSDEGRPRPHHHTTIRVQGATSMVTWQPINEWQWCHHSLSLFMYYCNSKYFTFIPTHPLIVECRVDVAAAKMGHDNLSTKSHDTEDMRKLDFVSLSVVRTWRPSGRL